MNELTRLMQKVVALSPSALQRKTRAAYRIAKLTEWQQFSKYYIEAHNLAVERALRRKS